jgi:hypothetical protein
MSALLVQSQFAEREHLLAEKARLQKIMLSLGETLARLYINLQKLEAHPNGRASHIQLRPAARLVLLLAVAGLITATLIMAENLGIMLESRRGGAVAGFDVTEWLLRSPANFAVLGAVAVYLAGGKVIDYISYLLGHPRWLHLTVACVFVVITACNGYVFAGVGTSNAAVGDVAAEIQTSRENRNNLELVHANMAGLTCEDADDTPACRELRKLDDRMGALDSQIVTLEQKKSRLQTSGVQASDFPYRLLMILNEVLLSACAFLLCSELLSRHPLHMQRVERARDALRACGQMRVDLKDQIREIDERIAEIEGRIQAAFV